MRQKKIERQHDRDKIRRLELVNVGSRRRASLPGHIVLLRGIVLIDGSWDPATLQWLKEKHAQEASNIKERCSKCWEERATQFEQLQIADQDRRTLRFSIRRVVVQQGRERL